MTSILLAAGANPNAENKDKRTPLHFAALGGHAPVAEVLLAAGANPNAENEVSGRTHLHIELAFNPSSSFFSTYS